MKKNGHFLLKLTAVGAAVCGIYLYLKDKGYVTVRVNNDAGSTNENADSPEADSGKSYVTIDSANLVEKAKEVADDVKKKTAEVVGDACDKTRELMENARDAAADAAEEAAQKAADSIEKAWYSTQETAEKVEPFFDEDEDEETQKDDNL
ncbi:MAG: hypothetical protein LUE16_00515 [Lachnospiraceae bacterium]|nr:hypothetical protein [Lachnospiraceae bacterium]